MFLQNGQHIFGIFFIHVFSPGASGVLHVGEKPLCHQAPLWLYNSTWHLMHLAFGSVPRVFIISNILFLVSFSLIAFLDLLVIFDVLDICFRVAAVVDGLVVDSFPTTPVP